MGRVADDFGGDAGTERATIELPGLSPSATFGPAPVENVVNRDGGNSGSVGDDSGGPGNAGSSGDQSGNDDGRFERNADGSVKRNADGTPKRKRGRKPGAAGVRVEGSSGRKAGKAESSPVLNVAGIERILLSGFGMAAAVLSAPEWALDSEEAKTIATATAEVAQYYPMEIDPKTLAWVNLAMVLTPAIGARCFLTMQRVKMETAAKARPSQVKPNEAPPPAKPQAPSQAEVDAAVRASTPGQFPAFVADPK